MAILWMLTFDALYIQEHGPPSNSSQCSPKKQQPDHSGLSYVYNLSPSPKRLSKSIVRASSHESLQRTRKKIKLNDNTMVFSQSDLGDEDSDQKQPGHQENKERPKRNRYIPYITLYVDHAPLHYSHGDQGALPFLWLYFREGEWWRETSQDSSAWDSCRKECGFKLATLISWGNSTLQQLSSPVCALYYVPS